MSEKNAGSPVVELVKAPDLGRGERAIIVNGERWGVTVVTSHGVWGMRHYFRQIGASGRITEINERGNEVALYVKSGGRHHKHCIDPDIPVYDRVLATARQLVAEGKLRHPDRVSEEMSRLREHLLKQREKRNAEEAATFRNRAMNALRINDPDSEIVARVVEAMRWAQSQ